MVIRAIPASLTYRMSLKELMPTSLLMEQFVRRHLAVRAPAKDVFPDIRTFHTEVNKNAGVSGPNQGMQCAVHLDPNLPEVAHLPILPGNKFLIEKTCLGKPLFHHFLEPRRVAESSKGHPEHLAGINH